METELLNIEKVSPEEKAAALKKAGEIIREGGLVAFPTETVCEDLCGEGETVR